MAAKIDAAKKIFWANVCVSSAVFKDKNLQYVFRANIHSDQYGDASCTFVNENAKSKFGKEPKNLKIAIIYEDGPYGTGIAQANEARCKNFGMDRYALEAASQDEEAAASVGIDVTREKLKVTAVSAAMCAVGGAIYAQYQMYIGPDTIAGLSVSLNIVFAVIAGGLWTMLGPTFGAVFTQVLSEVLRVTIQSTAGLQSAFGSSVLALDTLIYGLLLVLFIIYMPRGILGTILERRDKRHSRIAATPVKAM